MDLSNAHLTSGHGLVQCCSTNLIHKWYLAERCRYNSGTTTTFGRQCTTRAENLPLLNPDTHSLKGKLGGSSGCARNSSCMILGVIFKYYQTPYHLWKRWPPSNSQNRFETIALLTILTIALAIMLSTSLTNQTYWTDWLCQNWRKKKQ